MVEFAALKCKELGNFGINNVKINSVFTHSDCVLFFNVSYISASLIRINMANQLVNIVTGELSIHHVRVVGIFYNRDSL